jgi:dipeptidase E
MFDRFSENTKKLMVRARLAAIRLRHDAIEPVHMLIAMLEVPGCNAVALLQRLGADATELRTSLDLLPAGYAMPGESGQLPFTKESKNVLEATLLEAAEEGATHIGTQHLLLGMVRAGVDDVTSILAKIGIDAVALQAAATGIAPQAQRHQLRVLLISNSTMHGGGYLEHCAHEIRDFLGDKKRVLFVPYALHDHDVYTEKARAAFAAIGHDLSSVHQHAHSPAALADADAVFVGGGNTFRLLSALHHYQLLTAIRERALAGMPYIGSSAGTNVATPSIRTTNDMPIVQPPSFTALQLVPFQINPHYLDPDPESPHMGETREERIRQFHEEHVVPVLGLREGCLLRVAGERMELRGTTRARLFRRDREPEEFTPPCDLSFLLRD